MHRQLLKPVIEYAAKSEPEQNLRPEDQNTGLLERNLDLLRQLHARINTAIRRIFALKRDGLDRSEAGATRFGRLPRRAVPPHSSSARLAQFEASPPHVEKLTGEARVSLSAISNPFR